MHPTTDPTTRRRRRAGLIALATATFAASATATPAHAAGGTVAAIGRASVRDDGSQLANGTNRPVAISDDGRYLAFTSDEAITPGDTNGDDDAYVRDRVAGTTTRVGLDDDEGQMLNTEVCAMSRNGQFVAFAGYGGDADAARTQLYLRDRVAGTTKLVSQSTGGSPSSVTTDFSGVLGADRCAVSDDGRYVAFQSQATNLASGDANGTGFDIFRRDLQTGTTIRISTSSGGAGGNDFSGQPAMSGDGDVIAFTSDANNLVANDTNGLQDDFARKVSTSTTVRVSAKFGSGEVYGVSSQPAVSGDGTLVAFQSMATDLVPEDTSSDTDIFVKSLTNGAVIRASKSANGTSLTGNEANVSFSTDGKALAFVTEAGNHPGISPSSGSVVVKDLVTGATTYPSTTGLGEDDGYGAWPQLAANGAVAFLSTATSLVRGDTNGKADAFVADPNVTLSPFGTPSAFVTQQFQDFVGRAPTAAELTEWTARIGYGERTADQEIDELAHGAAFAAKREPMARLYWAFFLRTPDANGLQFWVNRLGNGWTLQRVAKQFAASSEFQTKYGKKTNAQFVTLIYQNIFQRDPDPGGLAYWTKKLDTGQKTRGDVMVNFSESSEGKRRLAPQVDAVLVSLGMLRRMPTAEELDKACAARADGSPIEVLIALVREGDEYKARVVRWAPVAHLAALAIALGATTLAVASRPAGATLGPVTPTGRVSVATDGGKGGAPSLQERPEISADGRFRPSRPRSP
ncbi:MAG: DUF4214 domain-containing protein [Acidimicrobiales bacterium]